jgi:hypothetical protein
VVNVQQKMQGMTQNIPEKDVPENGFGKKLRETGGKAPQGAGSAAIKKWVETGMAETANYWHFGRKSS